MMERRDNGKEGFRTKGIPEKREKRKEGLGQKECRTGEIYCMDRRDAGKVECRTNRMQDWRDAGKEGMQESRGGGTEL